MFQAVGDLVTLKWLREHPLIVSSFEAASAALSFAQGGGSEPAAGDGAAEAGARSVSWRDECGGKLEHLIEEPQAEEGERRPPPRNRTSTQLQPKCLQQDDTAAGPPVKAPASPRTPGSPNSPQWGWFVSMTPPQHSMYGGAGSASAATAVDTTTATAVTSGGGGGGSSSGSGNHLL